MTLVTQRLQVVVKTAPSARNQELRAKTNLNSTMVSVQDHIVLITGATSGIGAACARVFVKRVQSILAARRQSG